MTGPLWDPEPGDDDQLEDVGKLTFSVVSDATDCRRPSTQLVISVAEWQTMKVMPGGVCWDNWLTIRGMDWDGSPLRTAES